MTALLQKMSGGVRFLLLVLASYLLVSFFNYPFVERSLVDFTHTLGRIFPILLFVFAVIFLINIFINPAMLQKYVGRDSGLRGWCYTIIGSIIIAGPPYILFPLFGELQKQGMKNSLIVAFFSNRHVQPAFLPVMIYYFGIPFTVTISLYILIFSVVNGWVLGKALDKE